MKANFWVIATGKDCDGHNGGRVDSFANEKDAVKFAEDMNDWSDGICYRVISDIWDMKAYCIRYGKDWEKYKYHQ
jgi:hypothetical protein